MPDQSLTLLLALVLAIIIVIVLVNIIAKDISSNVSTRILEIENEKQFIERLQILKSGIDASTEERLTEKTAIRKEYLIEDAIRRSAGVTKGQIIEHFAPFMMSDILNPDEMVFVGSPIDLISFTGIDEHDNISIDFLEIKTGNSALSRKQKLIREAVFSKRVYYKKVHLND
jgi:predicted Holliday junction resolvase-like endonuclease